MKDGSDAVIVSMGRHILVRPVENGLLRVPIWIDRSNDKKILVTVALREPIRVYRSQKALTFPCVCKNRTSATWYRYDGLYRVVSVQFFDPDDPVIIAAFPNKEYVAPSNDSSEVGEEQTDCDEVQSGMSDSEDHDSESYDRESCGESDAGSIFEPEHDSYSGENLEVEQAWESESTDSKLKKSYEAVEKLEGLLKNISLESVQQEIQSGAKSDRMYKLTLERQQAAGQEIGLAQPYFNIIQSSSYLKYCIQETGTIDPCASETELSGGESETGSASVGREASGGDETEDAFAMGEIETESASVGGEASSGDEMADAFAMGESETGAAGVGGEETDVDDDDAGMAGEDKHDDDDTVKGNSSSLVAALQLLVKRRDKWHVRTLVNAEAETLVWQGRLLTEHSWEVIWLEKDGIVHASLLRKMIYGQTSAEVLHYAQRMDVVQSGNSYPLDYLYQLAFFSPKSCRSMVSVTFHENTLPDGNDLPDPESQTLVPNP
jgi:hypothetical protein